MDPLGIVIGLAVGAVIGGVIASMVGSKKGELEAAQKELGLAKKVAEQQKVELEKKVESAEEKSATAVKNSEAKQKDLQESLKKAKAEAEEAKKELGEHQQARQQAEGRVKQAEKLAADASSKASELEAQLAGAQEEATSASEIADRRQQEIGKLRAALSSAGAEGAGLDAVELFADAGPDLGAILNTLVEHEAQGSAVVADSNGIVIAGAGDKELQDGLSATAQLLSNIGKQFDGMVPFKTVQAFDLRDENSAVIAGRAWRLSGEAIAMATYGTHTPNARVLDGAMSSLKAALE